MFTIYNLLSLAAAFLLYPWLLYRAARGRLPGIGQRLGLIPPLAAPASGPVFWFHAVSLGEVKAAGVLIEQLRSRSRQCRVLITTSTRTGWQAAREMLPPSELVLSPPLDLAWICRRFLRRIRPQAVFVIETELWPNLFRETARAGCKLLLVNGRISDRAFPRYRASRFFWRRVLAFPDALLVQTEQDRERFLAIGAPREKVAVVGNLKFALRPIPSPVVSQLRAIAQEAAADSILVAGSTMPGEERLLLEAFRELTAEFPRLWMILAPRHPERFDRVAQEVRDAGIRLERRSQLSPATKLQLPGVLLLDTTGELGSVYELATVAFVGGTLVPTGGHNILEPARFGKPILIGPSMENFREIAEAFLRGARAGEVPAAESARVGAVVQIADSRGLAPSLRYLLRNPPDRNRIGEAARRLLEKELNPTDRILEELGRLSDCRSSFLCHDTGPAGEMLAETALGGGERKSIGGPS